LSFKLDEIDLKIIETLRRNARTHLVDIARDLGISDSTVHFRLRRMLEQGVIRKYTIEVDEEKALGRYICAFCFVNVKPGSLEEVARSLVDHEKVIGIYEIHGSNDLIAKVRANDLGDMRELVLEIRGIPNVVASQLNTVLKIWKEM